MTKKTCVRSLTLILCLLMLLTTMFSCAKEQTEEGFDDDVITTEAPSDSPYDENGYLKDSLDGLNYDGKTVNVITWDNNPYLFPWEANDEDSALRLVYNRDRYVEERLNIEFDIGRKTSSASADKEHANAR